MWLNWVMEVMVVGYTAHPFHGYFDQLQGVGEELVSVCKLEFIICFPIKGVENSILIIDVIEGGELRMESKTSAFLELGYLDVVCASLKLIIKTLKKNAVREIIKVLVADQKPLTAEEIIEKTGLPKATVYTNLKELERIGFVKIVEGKKPRKYTITKFLKKLLELPEDQEKESLISIRKLAEVTYR